MRRKLIDTRNTAPKDVPSAGRQVVADKDSGESVRALIRNPIAPNQMNDICVHPPASNMAEYVEPPHNEGQEVMFCVGLGMTGIAFLEKMLDRDESKRYKLVSCGEEEYRESQ